MTVISPNSAYIIATAFQNSILECSGEIPFRVLEMEFPERIPKWHLGNEIMLYYGLSKHTLMLNIKGTQYMGKSTIISSNHYYIKHITLTKTLR